MSSGDAKSLGRWRGLRSMPVHLTAFLTLALFPMGLLSIWQGNKLADAVQDQATRALVAQTAFAVAEEAQLLERGVGAVEVLAQSFVELRANPVACQAWIANFVEQHPHYDFGGFIERDGKLGCNSLSSESETGAVILPEILLDTPQVLVRPGQSEFSGDETIASLYWPVWAPGANGVFLGYSVLSLPESVLRSNADPGPEVPTSLRIFNRLGEKLHEINDPSAARSPPPLPAPATVAREEDSQMVTIVDEQGDSWHYVVQPMVADQVYAVAVWPAAQIGSDLVRPLLPLALAPLLMWAACLAVAYFAVHRLVVRPVNTLRQQMLRFGASRAVPVISDRDAPSRELDDLNDAFRRMSLDLLREEARLEGTLHDKNILLKEVHHRVKNNLQIMSAVISLQVRNSSSEDTRIALKRLQDRVLNLATVHQNLYRSDQLSRVNAQSLLDQILAQTLPTGKQQDGDPKLRISIEPVMLIPDQALPVALLTAEMASLASDVARTDPSVSRTLFMSLSERDGDMVELLCRLVPGSDATDGKDILTDHAAARLMSALATQLDSRLTIQADADTIEFAASFTVARDMPVDQDF